MSTTVEKLHQQLKDSNLKLRSKAVEELGELHDLISIPWLVEAIRDDEIQRREWLDEYQAEIDRTGGFTPMGGSQAIRPRMDAIKSADVAGKAVNALLEFDDSSIEPVVLALLDTARSKNWQVKGVLGRDWDYSVLSSVGSSLGKVLRKKQTPLACDLLLAALKDSEPRVRYASATALGELGDDRAVEPLTLALKDENSSVQIAAKYSLKNIQAPES